MNILIIFFLYFGYCDRILEKEGNEMKVGICSLGCKVNIYESEVVTDLLKKGGYEIVPIEDKADIYIPIYT